MIKKLAIFVLILSFTGCSLYQIDSNDFSDKFYPPKTSIDDVQDIQKVNKPHTVIGEITVNTERRQLRSEIVEKLKEEAAKLGGDAITNIKTDAAGIWKQLPGQRIIGNGYIRANFKADVIVFK